MRTDAVAAPQCGPLACSSKLFESWNLGALRLANRVVMSPMTRARCPEEIATELTAEYYAQRASAGLIVTEGTFVSPEARGYVNVPGLWTDAQAAGWSLTTHAVHRAGGRIVAQLWHVGRVSHVSLQPGGQLPISSTSRAAGGAKPATAYAITETGKPGFVPVSTPRSLSEGETTRVVDDFARSGGLAQQAGFDGVEVHAGNGYLFEQFLNPAVNDRTDAYGGSIAARSRLLVKTAAALRSTLPDRVVGVRLSPGATLFDNPPYPQTEETYLYLAAALRDEGVDYLHISDHRSDGNRLPQDFLSGVKSAFGSTVILAGGLDQHEAESFIERGMVDLAAFGRPFIANPDLVHRLQSRLPLAVADPSTYYGGGAEGYTDFPTISQSSHDARRNGTT